MSWSFSKREAGERLAGIHNYDKGIRMLEASEGGRQREMETSGGKEERRKERGLGWRVYQPREYARGNIPRVCSGKRLLLYRAQRWVSQTQAAAPHISPSPPLHPYNLHHKLEVRNWKTFLWGICACVNSSERGKYMTLNYPLTPSQPPIPSDTWDIFSGKENPLPSSLGQGKVDFMIFFFHRRLPPLPTPLTSTPSHPLHQPKIDLETGSINFIIVIIGIIIFFPFSSHFTDSKWLEDFFCFLLLGISPYFIL